MKEQSKKLCWVYKLLYEIDNRSKPTSAFSNATCRKYFDFWCTCDLYEEVHVLQLVLPQWCLFKVPYLPGTVSKLSHLSGRTATVALSLSLVALC